MHRELAKTILLFSQGVEKSSRPEDRKLANDYLAALAPLLAHTVIGDDVLKEIGAIERLFGNTWVIDNSPFETAFKNWGVFKEEYEVFALSSMTVNERLYSLELIDEFDIACKEKDESKIREILERARVDNESIDSIIKPIIKNG